MVKSFMRLLVIKEEIARVIAEHENLEYDFKPSRYTGDGIEYTVTSTDAENKNWVIIIDDSPDGVKPSVEFEYGGALVEKPLIETAKMFPDDMWYSLEDTKVPEYDINQLRQAIRNPLEELLTSNGVVPIPAGSH